MAISPPIAIPIEQIGSISGAVDLIERIATGESNNPNLALLCEDAFLDTFERAETTSSPVVTNDAQRSHHHSATYAMHGILGTAPDGFQVPVLDDHARGVLERNFQKQKSERSAASNPFSWTGSMVRRWGSQFAVLPKGG